MKRTFLTMLTAVVLLCLFAGQDAMSMVYNQFTQVRTKNYGTDFWPNWIDNGKIMSGSPYVFKDGAIVGGIQSPNDFKKGFQTSGAAGADDAELDDGYARVNLSGWTYRYNGVDYGTLYVSINGYVTFDLPPLYAGETSEAASNPGGLFTHDPSGSTPTNVIAPYWGDHKYWRKDMVSQGKTQTEISYIEFTYDVVNPITGATVTKHAILVQWKNLNINWRKFNSEDQTYTEYPTNITSFQVIIYEGPDEVYARQGDVEFRYNYLVAGSGTRGDNWASVGIKGSAYIIVGKGDYVNALYNGDDVNFPADAEHQQNYTTLTPMYPPVHDITHSIWLRANYSVKGDDNWGDGDADMSTAEGGRHVGSTDQTKYVTLNDTRKIMRSMVTGIKLDSSWREAAHHGDVNHNGRYFYMTKDDAKMLGFQRSNGLPVVDWEASASDIAVDTFYLMKIGNFDGSYGFLPKYGQNDNFIQIDFLNMGINGITQNNCKRTFRLMNPAKTNNPLTDDYQMALLVIDPNDRELVATVCEQFAGMSDGDALSKIRFRLKKNVVWRNYDNAWSSLQGLNLPFYNVGAADSSQLFFQANEQDASVILSYLEAKVPALPWMWDNPTWYEKRVVPFAIASNITFDNPTVTADGIRIPVYFNGNTDDACNSAKFTLNVDANIEAANANILVDYANRNAVIVANGSYDANTPVAYITISADVKELNATNVRFHGDNASDVNFKLTNSNIANDNILAQNAPNPVVNMTNFKVTIPTKGNYTLAIYDVRGNLVKVIASGMMDASSFEYQWDATNAAGEKVINGSYIYRLEGENISASKKLNVIK